MTAPKPVLTIAPLTPERFADLERLFGPNGACMGCWCMYWRWPHAQFTAASAAERRTGLVARVASGPPPGLIAYDGDAPVGWVQAGPRSDTPQWNTKGRLTAPIDPSDAADPGVWALSCFFIAGPARRRGVMGALIDGAVAFAHAEGARAVEACPRDSEKRTNPINGYVGLVGPFRRAGFVEVARRRADRPLMRLTL